MVVCDRCKTKFTLGKPKHKWIDKEKAIALKYQQCPKCKANFPAMIQTNDFLAKVRKLRMAELEANRLIGEKREEAVTESDLFQLEVLLEQERLKEKHGQGLGFLKRSCPKCGLSVTSLKAVKYCVGENEGRKIHCARLLCLCGWAGRYADLRRKM